MWTRPTRAVEFLLSTFAYSSTANFAYTVLPLFLFMGQMAFSAGLSRHAFDAGEKWLGRIPGGLAAATVFGCRSEEHRSELQSLMRTSSAVFCLKKNTRQKDGERPKTAR